MQPAIGQAYGLSARIERRKGPGCAGQIVGVVHIPAAEGNDMQTVSVADLVEGPAQLSHARLAGGLQELLPDGDLDVVQRPEEAAKSPVVLQLPVPDLRLPELGSVRVDRGGEDEGEIAGGVVIGASAHRAEALAQLAVPRGDGARLPVSGAHAVAGPAPAALVAAQEPGFVAIREGAAVDVVDVHEAGLDLGHELRHFGQLCRLQPLVREARPVPPRHG